ncbi:hypothetical protein C9374_006128 [Naegleria lovaniensis]|uniref:Uncharacterized protein n=1 Tax=Naegleria lovaniensis TaxID=51637 RepID=A0AA88GMK3_NAELO|nr:uncharacterized protein C9374_006128 [Naegleria lovaniensis]KAG2381744.1 hypothetical protein C9374_006128 [Naegleria lovaniensis]
MTSLIQQYPLVVSATLINLVQYLYTGFRVGGARVKYGVKAPATTGHPEFEKLYRIQMNGLEFLPVLLSSLWLAALTSQNDKLSGSLGLTYAVGRVIYGLGYPEKRGPGFLIYFLSIVGLLGVSAVQFFK